MFGPSVKRIFVALALSSVAAAPLPAQDAAAIPKDVVAVVNGESITKSQLDVLWYRMSEKARQQYDQTGGGKRGFLDNYIRKRLLLQQASAAGFEKSATVQAELEAAKEAALFDLYVRDVVAGSVVNEAAIRKFYEENAADFQRPEQVKARMILIRVGSDRSREEAREIATQALQELATARVTSGNDVGRLAEMFAGLARRYSDHQTANAGGNLGWVSRDVVDAHVATAAFGMQKGTFSGIIEAEDGMHLVLVEDRRPPMTEPYETARHGIREYLLGANTQKVVESIARTTADLQKSAKVTIYADNVD
jgi:peptidyl-prolyl cis-trans isomerase C